MNCWKPRSEPNHNVTREGGRDGLKMGEYVAISSQAPQECAEGSETSEYSPNVQYGRDYSVIMGDESPRVRDNHERLMI